MASTVLAGHRQACLGPFDNQIALELRHGPKHVQDELAGRAARIKPVLDRSEVDATGFEIGEQQASRLALFSNGTIAFRGTFTSIVSCGGNNDTTLCTHPAVTGLLTAASISALPAFAADNMQTAEELRTSQLVGAKVYNNANDNIGTRGSHPKARWIDG